MKSNHIINININRVVVLLLLMLVFSCADNDVDPIFNQSVNERSAALRAEYLEILTAPDNGWVGYYTPNKDFGVYTMLMNFDKDGSVKINSDYNQGNEDNSISYRIDKTLKIELVLETFAVFHKIFEINNNNNKGEFVFNIISATEDEVVLESKLDFGDDVTVFKLRKASLEDLVVDDIYLTENDLVGTAEDSGLRNILLNNEVIGSFSYSPSDRIATITYLDVNQVEVVEKVRLGITNEGFFFFDPISINGTELNVFVTNGGKQYKDTANDQLIIDDFLLCPFDIDSFVGVYLANEDGYCDGCYEVTITKGATENSLILGNLYDVGGDTEITLIPESAPSVNFSFGDYLYTSADFGDGATYNPSAVTGDLNDDISSFSTCSNYMDLYFRLCFDAGCFPVIHIQLTKK